MNSVSYDQMPINIEISQFEHLQKKGDIDEPPDDSQSVNLDEYSQATEIIDNALIKFKLKFVDIIMLVDYSKDMNLEQLKHSHVICKNVFEKLQN